MMSCSIVGDLRSPRVGGPISEPVMRDHQSPRARPHWNPCLGTDPPAPGDAGRLCEGRWRHLLPSRRPAAPSEFLVVNLIPEHDVEPHEQFPGNGDNGFGAAAAPKQGEVVTFEVDFRVGGDQAGLAQDEPKKRTALLGDLAEGQLSAEAWTAGARPM